MPGRDEYLLADHRFVVDRLVDAEIGLEQCREQRAVLLATLVMVRSYLATDVDEREGMGDGDVVEALIDPVLAGFEMGDLMRNHPAGHRRG